MLKANPSMDYLKINCDIYHMNARFLEPATSLARSSTVNLGDFSSKLSRVLTGVEASCLVDWATESVAIPGCTSGKQVFRTIPPRVPDGASLEKAISALVAAYKDKIPGLEKTAQTQ